MERGRGLRQKRLAKDQVLQVLEIFCSFSRVFSRIGTRWEGALTVSVRCPPPALLPLGGWIERGSLNDYGIMIRQNAVLSNLLGTTPLNAYDILHRQHKRIGHHAKQQQRDDPVSQQDTGIA
jgi:hypothetical protein